MGTLGTHAKGVWRSRTGRLAQAEAVSEHNGPMIESIDLSPSVTWTAASDPDPAELRELAEKFPFPPGALLEMEHDQFHVRVEFHDKALCVAFRTLTFLPVTADVETGSLMFIVTERGVLTIECGIGNVLAASSRIAKMTKPEDLKTSWDLFLLLLRPTFRTFSEVDQGIANEVTDLDKYVFSVHDGDPTERIYSLKREVAEARRALSPLGDALTDFASDPDHPLPERARSLIRHLGQLIVRSVNHLDDQDRLLGDMFQAHLAMVGVQQNSDMRKISAWGAIALVPTGVGAIYGMNFQNMPELTWSWGYPGAIVVMALACLGLHHLFKRSGWL